MSYKKIINLFLGGALFLLPILALGWPLITGAQESIPPLFNPLGTIDPNDLFVRLAAGLMVVTGTITLVIVVLGGYRILTAAGNSETFQKGKKMIAYALIGLVVTVGSYAILSTTIKTLTGGTPANFIGKSILFDPLNITKGPLEFYGERILGFALSGLGGLTLLVFIYSGLLWMTAAGNEEKITKARKNLGYGVVGLAVVLGAYSLINFVYRPVYQIFSGQQPVVEQFQPTPEATTEIPCFRLPLGKDYGAKCEMEPMAGCGKPKLDANNNIIKPQGQLIIKGAYNCEDVGACIQTIDGAPGGAYKNRILKYKTTKYNTRVENCVPELFKPISRMITNGACVFGELSNGSCYLPVDFRAGEDYPQASGNELEHKWACIRWDWAKKDFICRLETGSTCKKAGKNIPGWWGSPTEEAGKQYLGYNCQQIGQCTINLGGLKGCKGSVLEGMCKAGLFPPVGDPNPIWGCNYIGGSYELINGKCYVPDSGMQWVAGKECASQ